MATKQKPLKPGEMPVSVNTFSKADVAYIKLASKQIPFFVNVVLAQIEVPETHITIAQEDLNVMHLVNKFKFVIQPTIGATYNPVKEWGADFKGKVKPAEVTPTGIVQVGVGFEFKDTRDYNKVKRIFADKGKDWELLHVADMRPNYTMSKISFGIMIKDKLYLPCTN